MGAVFGVPDIKNIFVRIHVKKNIFGEKKLREIKMEKQKIIDLFCGAGGLSQGFSKYFETTISNDIQKDMVTTFKANHPETIAICGDIKNIDLENVLLKNQVKSKEICGVIGGPPCQGFSTVGNRLIDDPRNRLFKEFVKTVKSIKPNFFLMENVKGMLSMKNGLNEFVVNEIKKDFSEIGYTVQYKLLNALNYGVPQKRLRLFFMGFKKELNIEPSFPNPTHEGNGLEQKRLSNLEKTLTVKDAIFDLPFLESGDGIEEANYPEVERTKYQKKMKINCEKLYNHIAPNHNKYMIERIKRVPQGGNHNNLPKEYQLESGYPNIYGRLSWDKPADTITANCGCVSAPGRFIHPQNNRAITVREAARLQSFEDCFRFYGSKNSMYKQVGNAVPPQLAESLAKHIAEVIN